MIYGQFKNGGRCPKCFYERKKLSYKQIKKSIEKEGYILLSKEYKGCIYELKLQCPNGHIY